MKGFLLSAVALLTFFVAGCETASRDIVMKFQSEKKGVFTEVRNGDMPPEGFAYVTIRANIKTHIEGYYILESKESLHGKQGYPFIFNIDGQRIEWQVDGVKDVKPAYNPDGTTSGDPEAREGLKYVLEKKLRLAAGKHRVYFGLPEDNYSAEFVIVLKDGEAGTLELKPIYRPKSIPTRIPTFLKGIDKYEVFLDNKQII